MTEVKVTTHEPLAWGKVKVDRLDVGPGISATLVRDGLLELRVREGAKQ